MSAIRREELGLTDPLPMIGDRLVCLRNDRAMGLLGYVFKDADSIRMHQIKPDDGDGPAIEVTTHASFFSGTATTGATRSKDLTVYAQSTSRSTKSTATPRSIAARSGTAGRSS